MHTSTSSNLVLDLNCDMGESFGPWRMGDDLALLEDVSSANIACGFHAGDPATMKLLVGAAAARGVAIGAHPGLPDLQGFGRRTMQVSPADVYALTVYQVGALAGFAHAAGVKIHHVKPHGALYNMAAKNRSLADAMVNAVRDIDPTLFFYGLAGSAMIEAAQAANLPYASEVFADRAYELDGTLTARGTSGAMIENEDAAIAQLRLLLRGQVRARTGEIISLRADTLCLHGDQPGAIALARRMVAELKNDGVLLRAPQWG